MKENTDVKLLVRSVTMATKPLSSQCIVRLRIELPCVINCVINFFLRSMRVIGFYKKPCFSRNIDEQVNFDFLK